MMSGCGKCHKVTAWLFFLVGLALLLVDFGVWDFWGITWYAAVIFVVGLTGVAQTFCRDCEMANKRR